MSFLLNLVLKGPLKIKSERRKGAVYCLICSIFLRKGKQKQEMPLCKVITVKKKKEVFSGVLEMKNSRNCCLREHSSVFSSQTPRLMIFKTGISLTFLSRECIILSHLKSSFRGTLIGPVWRLRSRSTDTQLRGPTVSNTTSWWSLQLTFTEHFSTIDCFVRTLSIFRNVIFSHLTDNCNFG